MLSFGMRVPVPPVTVSRQLPALPGRAWSVTLSGTLAETAAAKPRAAIAAGRSTTRSIHIARRVTVASRSRVSHQNGSAGAVMPVTLSAVEQCEAITDQSARSACGDLACTRSTHRSSSGPAVGGEAVFSGVSS